MFVYKKRHYVLICDNDNDNDNDKGNLIYFIVGQHIVFCVISIKLVSEVFYVSTIGIRAVKNLGIVLWADFIVGKGQKRESWRSKEAKRFAVVTSEKFLLLNHGRN